MTVAMRWLNRLLGLVSTLVLARILVPADFGITAMASIAIGLVSVLLDIGVNVALIRHKEVTPAHYHSAWTLRLIQTSVIACVIFAASPLAGDYFRDARVTPVVALMAFNLVLYSLENIGIVSFQKNMQFGLEFRYLLINRVFGVACTIVLAFALRSYWALVISGTIGGIFSVLHSYRAHPMRPRFSTEKMREILSVSQWMLVQNISNYFDANLHKMLVGRRDDAAVMGAYSLSSELATMPSSELLQPLNRVLFPAFVAVKSDLAELKRLFLMAQSLQVMVALPAAVFLSVMSREAVLVLLGEKWLASAPLLQTLALAAAAGAVSVSAWYVGVALGRERSSALLACAQVLLFLALVFLAFPQSKAQDIANLRVVVASVGLVAQLWIVSNALGNIRAWEMLVGLWRSLVSVAIATAAIEALQLPGLGAFLTLLVKGAAFSLLYVFVVWGLWRTSGRPEGAERYLADTAKATLRRLTHRPN